MIEFLTASENFPFMVSLSIVFVLTGFELMALIVGSGAFGLFESLFSAADADLSEPNPANFLSWFRVEGVPFSIMLVVLLSCFGVLGLVLQSIVFGIQGSLLNPYWAAPGAFVAAVPSAKIFGRILSYLIPKDESSAVSLNSLVGKTATISLGQSRPGHPAQARVRDEFGQTHYIMVEPEEGEGSFDAQESVLLIRRTNSIYYAVSHPSI